MTAPRFLGARHHEQPYGGMFRGQSLQSGAIGILSLSLLAAAPTAGTLALAVRATATRGFAGPKGRRPVTGPRDSTRVKPPLASPLHGTSTTSSRFGCATARPAIITVARKGVWISGRGHRCSKGGSRGRRWFLG